MRGAGAIAGGVIAVPVAVKGVVELLLLADAGAVTGMGADLFKTLGRRIAGMSAAALREVVAREARVVCERELRATIEKVLPNGKKTVKIELTGSRPRDFAAANQAAGLKRTPVGYTWEHLVNEGEMMLVPAELHKIGHTGGVASFKDRTGLDIYE